MKETKDQKYSGLGGMDERDKIPKDRWKGWNIGETQGKMERMNDQEFSHLGGSVENWKYPRLVGIDGVQVDQKYCRLGWQGCKIGNTQVQVGCMKD